MPLILSLQGRSQAHPEMPQIRTALQRALPVFYDALGLSDPEISMLLTDDAGIQVLNRRWRDEDKATDVLSFPLYHRHEIRPEIPALGDIAIDIEYAQRLVENGEHQERLRRIFNDPKACEGWTLQDEVLFLTVHGLLHLIGHDHAEEEEELHMMREEGRLWLALQADAAQLSPRPLDGPTRSMDGAVAALGGSARIP